MKQLFYLPIWFLRAKLFGRKAPLQTVLFILDKCNLSCKHCSVYNHENPKFMTFDEIREQLEYSYKLGSRFVDLEGGEPTLWREGDRDINDVIRLAREVGFYSVTVTTNAQRPFADLQADSIWVSLDGVGEYHDIIRGKGAFSRLTKNIDGQNHPDLSVNMVINTENYHAVADTIEFVRNHPKIKSISLNFHTPYPGSEALFVPWELRHRIIDTIIEYKRKGYPIMNSVSGLKLMKDNNFKKECWVSNFILSDGSRHETCVAREYDLCDKCGLCMAGEMRSVFSLKPDTIFAGMKLRMKR